MQVLCWHGAAVAGPSETSEQRAYKKSLEAINQNMRSVLERIFQHMAATELAEEGMASSSSKASTMDIREFTLFLSQVCLSADAHSNISATAHKIFRGVVAARISHGSHADKAAADVVDGQELGFEDFLKCVRLVAAEVHTSVGDLVMPLLPQLAGQASEQIISMDTQSRALARISGELMLAAQTARAHDIGRLACRLQEVAGELVSCDRLCVYVVREGGALVSSWVKQEKQKQASCVKVLDEDEQAQALAAMFERCSKGDETDVLQSIGSRSRTINFREFRALLEALRLLPLAITLAEASDMFREVNRLIEDVSDADVHECNFEEFETLMLDVADKADTTVSSLLLSRPDLCGLEPPAEEQGPDFEFVETCAAPSAHVRYVFARRFMACTQYRGQGCC